MDEILRQLITLFANDTQSPIQKHKTSEEQVLNRLLRLHNRGIKENAEHISKTAVVMRFYYLVEHDKAQLLRWGMTRDIELHLRRCLKLKPGRTASGVATVTVLTRPWPCANDCLYCPNDISMPKSYQHNEPACQRALHNFFDPYLQVESRLRVLRKMGHVIDKVELIVLGGTWTDYPASYRRWFVKELFRAVNESGEAKDSLQKARLHAKERAELYYKLGFSRDENKILDELACSQALVNDQKMSYNEAVDELLKSQKYKQLKEFERCSEDELQTEHTRNESAACRVVGLVFETRPDAVLPKTLLEMRKLGATKIQIGIQSLSEKTLAQNNRCTTLKDIICAFEYLRLFGFKILVHTMPNLLGSDPEKDREDYRKLVYDPRFLPDEVKLYPTVLLKSARLSTQEQIGVWKPYPHNTLIEILKHDVEITPDFIRMSRMIRDFSAKDIVAGDKQVNLRQKVEEQLRKGKADIHEIRFREIRKQDPEEGTLELSDICYKTTVSEEHFLQWLTPRGKIAGFLRLSLPKQDVFETDIKDLLPISKHQAMIREVHIYGKVAGFSLEAGGAQHHGLGKELISYACTLAAQNGFDTLNVISSVGTRNYYRQLGFNDAGLYQQKKLTAKS